MTTTAKYQVSSFGEQIKDANDKFNTKKEAINFMKRMHSFMIEMEASTFSLAKLEIEDGETYEMPIQTKYTIHNY
ncbi:MAG: hypothetical protein OEY01_11070 [Desulfobulbaceae bacterium]|nr:hypothetical protein [Desulfobulbaceae bacterium]